MPLHSSFVARKVAYVSISQNTFRPIFLVVQCFRFNANPSTLLPINGKAIDASRWQRENVPRRTEIPAERCSRLSHARQRATSQYGQAIKKNGCGERGKRGKKSREGRRSEEEVYIVMASTLSSVVSRLDAGSYLDGCPPACLSACLLACSPGWLAACLPACLLARLRVSRLLEKPDSSCAKLCFPSRVYVAIHVDGTMLDGMHVHAAG